MSTPEYFICLNCESPTYTFEFLDGELLEVLCEACGNEETEQFATEEELDAMIPE